MIIGLNNNTFSMSATMCLVALLLQLVQSTMKLSIISSNPNAGATTDLQFTISSKFTFISAGSIVKFEFPADWNISSATGGAGTDFCETSCSLPGVSLTRSTPYLTVTNLFPVQISESKSTSIQYTVKGIENPPYETASLILMSLEDGFPYDFAAFDLSVQPPELACSITRASMQVSDQTDYEFTVNPWGLKIHSTDYALLQFPSKWENSGELYTFNSAMSSCTSSTSPSISCTKSNNDMKAHNLVPASTLSPFSFTMTNILNPGSVQENRQLRISLYNSASSRIGWCPILISGSVSRAITDLDFSYLRASDDSPDVSIGSIVKGMLKFKLDAPPKTSVDVIQLSLPPSLDLSMLSAAVTTFMDGEIVNRAYEVFLEAGNSFYFDPFEVDSLSEYVITLHEIILPGSSQALSAVQVRISRSGYAVAEGACCSMSFSEIEGGSAELNIFPNTVGSDSLHSFTITGLSLPYSKILIDFDPLYTLVSSTYSCSISDTLLVVVPFCTRSSSNSLLVENISSISSPYSLTLSIYTITTPTSLQTLSYNLTTIDSTHNQIERMSTIGSLQATQIKSASVRPSNSKVGETTVYQFSISNTNTLPPNSQLTLTFPPQILLSLSSQVYLNGVVADSSVSNSSYILIQIGNSNSLAAGGLQAMNITLSEVANALTLEQSDSFSILLMLSGGEVIERLNTGVYVTLTTPTVFDLLIMVLGDYSAYTQTEYEITIRLPIDVSGVYPGIYSSAQMQVSLPAAYQLISCSQCLNTSNLSFLVPLTTTTFTASISSVRNPFQSSASPITFSLSIDSYLSMQQSYSSLTFTPHSLAHTLTHSNAYLGEPCTVTISLSEYLYIPEMDYLLVTVPAEYGLTGLTASADYSNCSLGVSGRVVRVDNFDSDIEGLVLTFWGMTNPSSSPSGKWLLQIYSATNSLISESQQHYFKTLCDSNCRSCSESNSSSCLSCYFPNYLSLSTATCLPSCLSSQYLKGSTCLACSSSCLTCQANAHLCTSCPDGFFLYASECIDFCPHSTYADSSSNQCVACGGNCAICSNTTCQYCSDGYVLESGACLTACSSGLVNTSNICEDCGDNCSSCTIDSCLICENSTYLYQGSCLVDCPLTFYNALNGSVLLCEPCQPPCLSCQTDSQYCIECDASSVSPYLQISTCVSICSAGKYLSEQNKCLDCTSPCSTCTSDQTCTACESGYYLYAHVGICYTTCPNYTIALNQECQRCIEPCLECSGLPTTCTSCIASYFLDGTTCNSTCSLPYFAIDRICTRCASPCSTCANLEPYSCTTCIADYYLLSDTCYDECPEGTYASGASCAVCSSGCFTCSASSSNCLSCYPGLYLYFSQCLSACPTVPIYYYQYQKQCIPCQPECLSCISTPVECSSCSSSSDYFNLVTRECSSNCSNPYFPGLHPDDGVTLVCIKCTVPCNTCTTDYNLCSSCINGYYLHLDQCLTVCPTRYHAQVETNLCQPCPSNCIHCTSTLICTTCDSSTYEYKGQCYTSCPSEAPYLYQSKYCRNCLKGNCLVCNSKGGCILCEPSYLLHDSACVEWCPQDYEPDSVTQSKCIVTDESALLEFLTSLEKYKVYMTPGSLIFLLSLLIFFSYHRCNNQFVHRAMFTLLGLPQMLAYLCVVINTTIYPDLFFSQLPYFTVYALFAIFCALNLAHCLLVSCKLGIMSPADNQDPQQDSLLERLSDDKIFRRWLSYGSNYGRYVAVLIVSTLVNWKIFYFIFTGMFKLPITSCQVSANTVDGLLKGKLKIPIILTILIVELPFIAYCSFTLLVEKLYITNYKLFFASLDAIFLSLISLTLSLTYLKAHFSMPKPYHKYIIEGISNRSLPALSEPITEEPEEEDDDNGLHRSNSTGIINGQSEEMKKIQFNSAFDPDEFEDPPFFDEAHQIKHAIKDGKFRKKNLKKKRKRGDHDFDLDIISEESEDSKDETKKKKKKNKMKKTKHGFLNNYMYWKPPEEKKEKKKEMKLNPTSEKEIMRTIREKQSEFDTITRNDIIFQEEILEGNSSHDSDSDFSVEDSRRVFNIQYENFLNKNYASKRHLQ